MRILVLGANGMLGHKLMQVFSSKFEVWGTVRGDVLKFEGHPVLSPSNLVGNVRAEQFETVKKAIGELNPSIVVNGIGLVKQRRLGSNPQSAIMINALFPHQLAQVCELNQVKMIHISTDCVFSGKVGNYSELDIPDGPDLYGRTKLLGEVTGPKALTFRTSLIGRELLGASGLVEWFLSQQGKEVWGYSRSIFSGFTTQAFGKFLLDVIENHGDLQGIWHISSDPISKYDLLQLFKKYFKISIHINGNETLCCDRSLNSGRFRSKFGFLPPTWQEMVQQLAEDPTPYHQMRRIHVNQ